MNVNKWQDLQALKEYSKVPILSRNLKINIKKITKGVKDGYLRGPQLIEGDWYSPLCSFLGLFDF